MSSSQRIDLIKPKPLPKNGTIAITAPATMPDAGKLNRGVLYLESLGYHVKVGKTCTSKLHYLAGDDELRAKELMVFFEDKSVDAIFCARGGYGGMHLLPLIDFEKISKSPKLFSGFSDVTSLEWAFLAKCNMVSISGGMVATDMGIENRSSEFESQFWDFIDSGLVDIRFDNPSSHTYTVTGNLLPGTLAVAAKQMSSPYFPDLQDTILLFEDVDEPRHKIEGYLRQFALSGAYNKSKAVVLGHFTPPDIKESDVPSLLEIYQRVFQPSGIPYASGINYGHVENKISLPVGVPISLSLGPITRLRSTGSIYQN
jgi:muramoyltetrapeptide carboxypeptidase